MDYPYSYIPSLSTPVSERTLRAQDEYDRIFRSQDGDDLISRSQEGDDRISQAQDEHELEDILRKSMNEVAKDRWAWLPQMLELGFDTHAIAQLLMEQRRDTPWVPFEPWAKTGRMPQGDFHIENCAHGRVGTKGNANSSIDVDDTIASLCGLAGTIPIIGDRHIWEDDVSSLRRGSPLEVHCKYRTHGAFEDVSGLLLRVTGALDRFCSAATELQLHEVCCDRYTYMHYRGLRDKSQVCLSVMPFTRGMMLLQSLTQASFHPDSSTLRRELSSCVAHSKTILRDVLAWDSARWAEFESSTDAQLKLHICALAVQFLCLSLVSYCQAHVGALKLFFVEREICSALLMGSGHRIGGVIRMELRLLTCLSDMLESPVMVFSPHIFSRNEGSMGRERYDLVATLEDIIDTWGPAGLITAHQLQRPWNKKTLIVSGILIRGGIIRKTNNGRLWHWSMDAGRPTTEPRPESSGTKMKQVITVGALVTKNMHCVLDETNCLSISDTFRDPLGSYTSCWLDKQRQFGLSGGQYVNLQYIHVREKDPGRTLKMHKVEHLYRLLKMSSSDQLLPFLEGSWGLQVSFCSGVARRVKMREVFADILPVWMHRKVPSPDRWEALRDNYQVSDVLRRGDLNSWIQKLCDENPQCYVLLCEMIVEITNQLAYTGVDKMGQNFVIAWIPSQQGIDVQCVRVSIAKNNFWISVLKDTHDCATFAYLTLDCLQAQGRGCQNPHGSLPDRLSFVETEVYRHFGGHEGGQRTVPQSKWTLQNEHFYAIGRPDQTSDALSQLHAQVSRPTEAAIPRLVVKPRSIPYAIWVRIMRSKLQRGYLRERTTPFDTVHKVTIASTSEE